MSEEKSAEDELKDATWVWITRLAIAASLVGAGYVGAYMQYGDAADLRQENKEQRDRIVDLENQRETTNTKLAKQQRDKEVCLRELRDLKKAM